MQVSEYDKEALKLIRERVEDITRSVCRMFQHPDCLFLDIAPNEHGGAKKHVQIGKVFTADINPANGPDIVLDICENNSDKIADGCYDVVICTEVLEHTQRPWDAANEIHRILRPGGIALVTTPFNFRIHGPLPDGWKEGDPVSDYWRFTEHGIRILFSKFKEVHVTSFESDRPLMPYHYSIIAVR